MESQSWDTVAIVGVGLIGGSIGLALRERGLARKVIGIGRTTGSLDRALVRAAVSEVTTVVGQGVAAADLIVVCTPVQSIADLVVQVAASCPPDAIITDAGSTKRAIVAAVSQQLTARRPVFVGSHPLAGSEKQGVEHASHDLFVDRQVIVTPTDQTPAEATDTVRGFWSALGARVTVTSAAEHDRIVAITSHLPHLVASILAATTPDEYLPWVATGWCDATRIAAGDPELWWQILEQNRTEVLAALNRFRDHVANCRRALEARDAEQLVRWLKEGKRHRDAVGN